MESHEFCQDGTLVGVLDNCYTFLFIMEEKLLQTVKKIHDFCLGFKIN